MASKRKEFHTKAQGPDVIHDMDINEHLDSTYNWTEPPYFDEHPEERDYRLASLPEHERVAEEIGPEYSKWNDGPLR